MLQPITNEPVRNKVLASIRKKIFSGEFPPGYELNPERLAGEFGVSRTPVREALQLLEGEGLIDYVPKHGACVKEISVDFLDDYYDTRKWLMGLSFDLICRREFDQDTLKNLLADETKAYETHNIEALLACGSHLEKYIYHICGSPRLEEYLIQLREASPNHFSRNNDERNRIIDATYSYHRQLVNTLCRRDSQAAQELNSQHMDLVKNLYIRYRNENNAISSASKHLPE